MYYLSTAAVVLVCKDSGNLAAVYVFLLCNSKGGSLL